MSFWPQMLEEGMAKSDMPFMQNRNGESRTRKE
jgi:hypothetical protein